MAQHELRAGGVIETVNPDELRDILSAVLGERFPAHRGPQVERPFGALTVNAAGDGTLSLFEVPAGMEFELRSLYISGDGYSPATHMSTGYAYLRRGVGGAVLDDIDFTATGTRIPVRVRYTSDGPFFHEREIVAVEAVAVVASMTLTVQAQGVLSPLVGVE